MTWLQPEPWAFAVVVASGLAIWGKAPTRKPVHWVFKPLATSLILAAAALLPASPAGTSRTWVLVALTFSLIGDIILMMPARVFAAGLLAFLVAQITYAVGFAQQIVWSPRLFIYAGIIVPIALGVARFVWPHAGRLRPAILIYSVAIGSMALAAAGRLHSEASVASAAWGVAGAALFLLADTLLAARRFVDRKVPYVIELGTYFAAQWCLASTIWT